MREALLMLELQGTVDIRQGSGVYVMRIPHENDSEEEQLLSSDVGPFEILQARQLLESNIAAFAAKMATRADIDNLKRIIEQEQRAIALNDTAQDNARLFHLVLAGATQNQMLLATVERIWLQMDSSPLWQQFNVHIASRAWRLKWLGDRQTLLAALRRRDVMGAWQAMWQHLENVKNSLLELSDEDAPDFDGYLFDSVPIFQGSWYDDPAAVRCAAVRPAGNRLAVARLWRRDAAAGVFASIVQHSQTAEALPLTFIAVEGEQLLGTIGLWRCDLISRQDLFPWLAALYVAPAARGQGLAGKLQRHVIDYARRAGFRELYLYSACRDFYERFGWRYIGEGLDYPATAVHLYRYDLSPSSGATTE